MLVSKVLRNAWAAGLVAVAAGSLGIVLVTATPAAAATPQCVKTAVAYGIDEAGDSAPLLLPASSGGSINCWLAKGDQNAAVLALQRAINSCDQAKLIGNVPYTGLYPLATDGNYGTHTQHAVWDIQYVGGIPKDGVYGSQTRNAMEWPTTSGWGGATCGSL
jgi:hypothetical protein